MSTAAKSLMLLWTKGGKCELEVTHADGSTSRFFMHDATYNIAFKPAPGAPDARMALGIGPAEIGNIRTGTLIAHVEGLLATASD